MYVAAAALYLVVFVIYPMIQAIVISLTSASLLSPTEGRFVGLANYRAEFGSPALWHSIGVTVLFTAVVTVAALLAGLACALLLDRWPMGRGTLQALLAVPWAIPSLVAGLLFVLIYGPHTGVLNYVLREIGLPQVGWLTNNTVAFWSVCGQTVWALYPFVMLVSVAALRAVPSDLYDAAAVDGAKGWTLLRWVTLPSISPTLRMISLFLVIFAFQQFQAIWVMTEGGPINGTNFLVINVYKTAFVDDDLGRASAVGVIGLVLSTIVTIAYFIEQRRTQGGRQR